MTCEFEGENVRTTLRARCASEICVRTASFPGTAIRDRAWVVVHECPRDKRDDSGLLLPRSTGQPKLGPRGAASDARNLVAIRVLAFPRVRFGRAALIV